MQKTLKKSRKQIEKNIENEEKERQRIHGKLNNNNKHFWFTFYIKIFILLENIILKKPKSYHHILFTVFMRCRVFETQ